MFVGLPHAVVLGALGGTRVNFWWQPDQLKLSKTSFHAVFAQVLRGALSGKTTQDVTSADASPKCSPNIRRVIEDMEDMIRLQYRL